MRLGSTPSAPSSLNQRGSGSFVPPSTHLPTPPNSMLAAPAQMPSSLSSLPNSIGLMNSPYMAGGNPGAYAMGSSLTNMSGAGPMSMSVSPPAGDAGGMQVGIASMMASHGAGGFSEMMSHDSHDISNSDEDLFAVSL